MRVRARAHTHNPHAEIPNVFATNVNNICTRRFLHTRVAYDIVLERSVGCRRPWSIVGFQNHKIHNIIILYAVVYRFRWTRGRPNSYGKVFCEAEGEKSG